ncbi:helix-turn-helix domain-containing protein [Parvibaculum sp.]|jgi:predicted XRE-type DNA-binding protein|uniref:helix-turn-helix domain-containing protein n=1 Tax=Parvibaculum sp. TaxID=2024848 RepID=UPI002FDA6EB2
MLVNLSEKLFARLRRKTFRDAYVAENVRNWIAFQIRALRMQRNMQQGELAKLMGRPQSVVSRFENPDYGKLTLSSLFEIAAAMDVALLVKFVSFPEFLRQTRDVTPRAMHVESFREDCFRVDGRGNVVADTGSSVHLIQLNGSTTTSTAADDVLQFQLASD